LKYTKIWIIAALALMALVGCTGKSSPSLITVNGDTVTNDQLYRYIAKKPTVRVTTQSGVVEAQVAEPMDFQGLQDLIGQKVILQLAKDEGVFPKDAEVVKELAFRQKLNRNYVAELDKNGITLATIKENLLLELARENLLTKGITVTLDEAKKYVRDNPADFMDPATADLLWVFVRNPAKKAVVEKAILSGDSFDSIAAQHSDFTSAESQGGRFPNKNVSSMPEALQKMVSSTPEGKTTDWLQLEDGHAVAVGPHLQGATMEVTLHRLADDVDHSVEVGDDHLTRGGEDDGALTEHLDGLVGGVLDDEHALLVQSELEVTRALEVDRALALGQQVGRRGSAPGALGRGRGGESNYCGEGEERGEE
jgi:hypothetical protein